MKNRSILLPMYISEPRAERLGWTTYRALRYIHVCTCMYVEGPPYCSILHTR